MTATPGFARQPHLRTAFRVLGSLVLVAGVAMFGYGIVSVFGSTMEPSGIQILCFVGGLLVIGVGLMLLQWGFLGAAARYGAGETMPVLKDSAAYLSDGEGVLGVGRTAGVHCSACGVRNDSAARFCDSCGTRLAVGGR